MYHYDTLMTSHGCYQLIHVDTHLSLNTTYVHTSLESQYQYQQKQADDRPPLCAGDLPTQQLHVLLSVHAKPATTSAVVDHSRLL